MHTSTSVGAFALVLPAVLGWGCGGGPTQPDSLGARLARLEISGPGSVAPGQTAQYSATAVTADGSTRNVTSAAIWQTSDPSVLTLVNPGAAAGYQNGDATLSATFEHLRSTMPVVVAPAGTFRLSGVVRETGSNSAVNGARIQVVGGAAASLATTTNAEGQYRLFGVSGTVRIRVSSTGFLPYEEEHTVADHRVLDVDLRPVGYSGRHTLAIEVSTACQDAMPAQLRNRTYTAEIRQVDSRISVQLGGREFSVNGPVTYNLLTGRVAGTTIVFDHLSGDWWGDYPPAIVEQLTSSSTLVITGRIVVSERGGRLDGTLDGRLDVMSQDGVMPTASCHATDHRVVLTR